MNPLLTRLARDGAAHLFNEPGVERACEGARRGIAHRCIAFMDPEMICGARLVPQAMRAVRQLDRRDAPFG